MSVGGRGAAVVAGGGSHQTPTLDPPHLPQEPVAHVVPADAPAHRQQLRPGARPAPRGDPRPGPADEDGPAVARHRLPPVAGIRAARVGVEGRRGPGRAAHPRVVRRRAGGGAAARPPAPPPVRGGSGAPALAEEGVRAREVAAGRGEGSPPGPSAPKRARLPPRPGTRLTVGRAPRPNSFRDPHPLRANRSPCGSSVHQRHSRLDAPRPRHDSPPLRGRGAAVPPSAPRGPGADGADRAAPRDRHGTPWHPPGARPHAGRLPGRARAGDGRRGRLRRDRGGRRGRGPPGRPPGAAPEGWFFSTARATHQGLL